jgi:hypothetical protein
MRLAIAGLVLGVLPVAAMADHRYCDGPDRCDSSYRYESRSCDRGYGGYGYYGGGNGGYDRPVYREYRVQSCDPPPVQIDDLGDGRHYLDHHRYYDSYGYEHHYHHIHHYDD